MVDVSRNLVIMGTKTGYIMLSQWPFVTSETACARGQRGRDAADRPATETRSDAVANVYARYAVHIGKCCTSRVPLREGRHTRVCVCASIRRGYPNGLS